MMYIVSEVVVLVECVNLIASLPTYLPSSTVVSNNTIHKPAQRCLANATPEIVCRSKVKSNHVFN